MAENQSPVTAPVAPVRVAYLTSTAAAFKLAELICDVIVLSLASVDCWGGAGWIGFCNSVILNGTLFFFTLHYVGIAHQFKQDTSCSIEFIAYVCFTVIYFINAIILAASVFTANLSACAVFSFIASVVYLADTIFLLVSYRRERAAQQLVTNNSNVNADQKQSGDGQLGFGQTNAAFNEYVNTKPPAPSNSDAVVTVTKGPDAASAVY